MMSLVGIKEIVFVAAILVVALLFTLQGCRVDRVQDKYAEQVKINGTLRVTAHTLSTNNVALEKAIEVQNEAQQKMIDKHKADLLVNAEQLDWAMGRFRDSEKQRDSLMTAIANDTTFTCDSLFIPIG